MSDPNINPKYDPNVIPMASQHTPIVPPAVAQHTPIVPPAFPINAPRPAPAVSSPTGFDNTPSSMGGMNSPMTLIKPLKPNTLDRQAAVAEQERERVKRRSNVSWVATLDWDP